MPRVGLFVDAANLYHSAKHLHEQNVNFPAIVESAKEFGQLTVQAIYVIRSVEGKEEGFFRALSNSGFTIREKDLQVYSGGAKKGDWDVGITVDIVRAAPELDVILLGSGDGDFAPLVEYLQEQGKQVVVVAFARSSSAKLKELITRFIDLGAEPDKYLIRGSVVKVRQRRAHGKNRSNRS